MKPAEALAGLALTNGWVVSEQLSRSNDATGGCFSVSYLVERSSAGTTEHAFLKALDLTIAGELGLPIADGLRLLTDAYVFERNLVLSCADRRMRNVVLGIDADEIRVDPALLAPGYGPFNAVPYIIFERADGDVRAAVAARGRLFDEAWAFRVLHGVANGLRQLHEAGIAHQDLKPSNVMTFGDTAKVGDLGHAATQDGSSPFDGHLGAGDITYKPPELLYQESHKDARYRRLACDTYHLGSVLTFLFVGAGVTALIESELDPVFHWRTWPRDYRNALPYVRNAYDRVIDRVEGRFPDWFRQDVGSVVRELTDPDPLVRGNPRYGQTHARFSMHRYVSLFDRLSTRAEALLRGRS